MTTENWKRRITAILDQLDEKDLRAIWFFVRHYGKEVTSNDPSLPR